MARISSEVRLARPRISARLNIIWSALRAPASVALSPASVASTAVLVASRISWINRPISLVERITLSDRRRISAATSEKPFPTRPCLESPAPR
jgi:hypothetical protein